MSEFQFANDNARTLWAEEQLRILWEFLEKEDLVEEANEYVKKELDNNEYT
jgi:hypothetical protein